MKSALGGQNRKTVERKSFVFYLNWHKILKKYPAQVRYEVYDAIMEYAASGTLADLKPQAQMAFDFIKDELDKNLEKFESKVESRRRAANERWNKRNDANAEDAMQKMQMHILHSENENENENENVSSNEDIKEKPSKEGKKKSASAPAEILEEYLSISQDENYIKFLNWTKTHTPYIAGHIPPLTEEQFRKLRDEFGATTVRICMENIENRKDLRKKYSDLYRTLINWCKREKGEET